LRLKRRTKFHLSSRWMRTSKSKLTYINSKQ
jgi:hypothetical protein